EDMATPAAEQRRHTVEDLWLVIDTKHDQIGELVHVDALRFAALRVERQRGRKRHRDGETRSASGSGDDIDAVIEHARDALDDREPEPKPARHLRSLIEPLKFLEDCPLL